MKRNKFFSRFIVVTLTAALLLVSGGRAIRVSALAVGPLADPVYDTEIFAFKDYVEQNLDAPQLDIMFFLIGGLAVAQMGSQDAKLITPYPNEESVKEWIINCGIQLYNTVIGLVPEGDYYVGIPSIGSPGVQGVPKQVIKALVAQMMGDAVVAINYPDLDTFLDENPNELLLPINPDLQLGVNAVFGLNGGLYDWQFGEVSWDGHFTWRTRSMSQNLQASYDQQLANLPFPHYFANGANADWNNIILYPSDLFPTQIDIFINTAANRIEVRNLVENRNSRAVINDSSIVAYTQSNIYMINQPRTFNPANFESYYDLVNYYISQQNSSNALFYFYYSSPNYIFMNYAPYIHEVRYGTTWDTATLYTPESDLNFQLNQTQYYQQVANDYLFDLRGLMGDLVNYVYTNKIWDNIYDLVGNLVVPDLVNVSVDLTPITDLLAPPVPVNLNDIAELTDNTYLERVKEHARNAGDIFANYVAFWHNCDSDLVYTVFGAAILVLVGAFVGKWGHS